MIGLQKLQMKTVVKMSAMIHLFEGQASFIVYPEALSTALTQAAVLRYNLGYTLRLCD